MKRCKLITGLLVVVLGTFLHSVAAACPSCYGAADSAETQGMNWAILSLLGVTGGVLVVFSAFFVFLRQRALEFNRRFSNRLN